MERRIVLFLSLSIAVLIGNYFLQAWIRGPLPDVAQQNAAKQQDKKATAKKDGRPETAKKEAPAAGDQKKAARLAAIRLNPTSRPKTKNHLPRMCHRLSTSSRKNSTFQSVRPIRIALTAWWPRSPIAVRRWSASN